MFKEKKNFKTLKIHKKKKKNQRRESHAPEGEAKSDREQRPKATKRRIRRREEQKPPQYALRKIYLQIER